MMESPVGEAVLPAGAAAPAATPARSWLAVLSVAAGTFALVTSEFLPVGLLPGMAADLGITDGKAGLTVTSPGLIAAVAAPALAVAAGRLDRRFALWGLMALLVASNLIVALSTSFPSLLAGRLLLGVAIGGFWTIGVAIGPRLVAAPDVARATSVIFVGISIGTVLGVPAGALIGDLAGWRAAFAATAATAVVALLAQIALLPALPPTRAIRIRDLPALFRVPNARIGLIGVVFMVTGHFAAYTYVTPFLIDAHALDQTTVTTLLLAYGVAGMAGTFLGGAAAARHVRPALTGAVLLTSLTVLLLPVVSGLPTVAALIALWGFAFGGFPIAIQMWMFKAAPHALESGAALLVTTFQVALASGAFIGGVAVDGYGTSSAMWLGGVLPLLTVAAIWLFTRGRVA